MRAQDFSAGTDYEQLVESQRSSQLWHAHADRQSPLIEIARFQPDQGAIDQRVVAAQGFSE